MNTTKKEMIEYVMDMLKGLSLEAQYGKRNSERNEKTITEILDDEPMYTRIYDILKDLRLEETYRAKQMDRNKRSIDIILDVLTKIIEDAEDE